MGPVELIMLRQALIECSARLHAALDMAIVADAPPHTQLWISTAIDATLEAQRSIEPPRGAADRPRGSSSV